MNRDFFGYDSVEITPDGTAVKILDQTELPNRENFIYLSKLDEIIEAIVSLRVRGAPAIGIAGSFGLTVILKGLHLRDSGRYLIEFERISAQLIDARPTAVNLLNNIKRLKVRLHYELSNCDCSVSHLERVMLEEAIRVKEDDISANLKMAEYGLSLLKPGSTILTYCNAGHLAVSRYGTALAPVYLAKSRGEDIKVIACETRPLFQGARITTFELNKCGIDTTLICDNMAASVLSKGFADAVITGCDRVASNGDTANKIGTLSLSVLAGFYKIPHYVIGPSTTIDPLCESGDEIVIEQRAQDEVTTRWFSSRIAPEGVKVYNPAFDVTPAELISAIITEKGIYRYPYNFKEI